MMIPHNRNRFTRIALIILVFTVLRIALPAMPSSWTFLIGLRFLIVIFSREWFHYDWALWDLFLLFCAICSTLMVPAPKNESKRKRYLLPVLTTVLIFVISTPLVAVSIVTAHDAYDGYQDWLRQKTLDATYREIREFLEDTDVGYSYNTNVQRHDSAFLKAFPELASTHLNTDDGFETKTGYHATDVILLDYDTHRVGIVYFRYGDPEFYLYKLQPVDRITSQFPQHTTQLTPPGETFVSYSYSFDLGQYTDMLALTMTDGSIYAVTGLSKENDLLFLGLNSTTELLNYWSDKND